MKNFIIICVSLIALAAILFPFYLFVGSWLEFSNNAQDWGLFGDYFGGVAGTVFSFLSFVILLLTYSTQQQHLEAQETLLLKQDILLHISKIDDEIERWLDKSLARNSKIGENYIRFGDLVHGLVSYNDSLVSEAEFNRAIDKLLKLTYSYSAAINLYEDNIDSHFVHHHYRQKATELVDFLDQHVSRLSNMAAISLSFCKQHLNVEANS